MVLGLLADPWIGGSLDLIHHGREGSTRLDPLGEEGQRLDQHEKGGSTRLDPCNSIRCLDYKLVRSAIMNLWLKFVAEIEYLYL